MRVATMVPSASRRPLDADGFADLRGRELRARQAAAEDGRCADAHAPALDLEQLAAAFHCAQRTDRGVDDVDCLRARLGAAAERAHGDDLADAERGRGSGLAVQRDRRGGVEVHFDAVHADAGEAGDDAEHAELRVGALTRAADAAGVDAGAADAARIDARPPRRGGESGGEPAGPCGKESLHSSFFACGVLGSL